MAGLVAVPCFTAGDVLSKWWLLILLNFFCLCRGFQSVWSIESLNNSSATVCSLWEKRTLTCYWLKSACIHWSPYSHSIHRGSLSHPFIIKLFQVKLMYQFPCPQNCLELLWLDSKETALTVCVWPNLPKQHLTSHCFTLCQVGIVNYWCNGIHKHRF